MHYTYMVLCSDQTLYTGYTNDIHKRLQAHNSGRGAKYTKNRGPVRLVFWQAFDSQHEAMSAEWHYKRLSRMQKLQMVENCRLLPACTLQDSSRII